MVKIATGRQKARDYYTEVAEKMPEDTVILTAGCVKYRYNKLALLSLGVKGIRLGTTLPGFLSPNVAKVLVDTFDIKPIGTVKDDVEAMMKGE